jgi:hypothetical protein
MTGRESRIIDANICSGNVSMQESHESLKAELRLLCSEWNY